MPLKKNKNINIEQSTPDWDELEKAWDKKVEEVEQKAKRIDVLKDIYEKVVSEMQWNSMEYHSPDAEHSVTWYTYDPESYHAWKYPHISGSPCKNRRNGE